MKTAQEIVEGIYPGDNATQRTLRAVMVAAIEADRHQIREYLDEHEHPDDWGVTCVYTRRLREALGIAKDAS